MENGYVKTRIGKVLVMGSAGSGKTCTVNVLLGKPSPKKRISTPLATRPVTVSRVDASSSKWKTITPSERKKNLSEAVAAQSSQPLSSHRQQERSKVTSPPKSAKLRSLSPAAFNKKQRTRNNQKTHPEQAQSEKRAKSSTVTRPVTVSSLSESIDTSSPLVDELASLIDHSQSQKEYCGDDLVQITDSGGQPQFHEMLPNFLHRTDVFIFVFKLSENLDNHTTIEFYNDEGNRLCLPYISKKTNIQVFKHCVRTMQSYKKKSGKAPRIVLVGTHRDKEDEAIESREAKEKKFAEILLPTFQEEVVYSSFHGSDRKLIHAINAVEPDEVDQAVTSKICDLIMSEGVDLVNVPVRWNALEIALQIFGEAHKRTVLSKEECWKEARKLHFDNESFEAALDYFHNLNILFYFKVSLPNIVFVDPQVLLDKATELVMVSHQLKHGSSVETQISQKRGSQKFQDHGLLTIDFLSYSEFKQHYVEGIFTPKELTKLFQDLLLFANFSNSEYFMPALLKTSDKIAEYRVSEASESKACPLIVIFSDGVPQLGMFCSAIVSLLCPIKKSPWKLKLDKKSHQVAPKCLYRNCVEFTVPTFPGSVIFIDSFQNFEVHILLPSHVPRHVVQKMCCTVKNAIEVALKMAADVLDYDIQPLQFGYACPCGKTTFHSAEIHEDHQLWICTSDRDICDTITDVQRVWLSSLANDQGKPMYVHNVHRVICTALFNATRVYSCTMNQPIPEFVSL